ncbi:hypothetical protein CMI37_30230 [Candidatus Pacearchaeota archaeon]|nr:hypothetical protein [Candidatus Pacearchaeota archaeon]
MGREQRRKGHDFERWVAKWLRDKFPLLADDIKRGWQSAGPFAPDVMWPGNVWFECKRGKKPNPRAALTQALGDAPDGHLAVGIIKDDRAEPFVVLTLDHFEEFLRAYQRSTSPTEPEDRARQDTNPRLRIEPTDAGFTILFDKDGNDNGV